MAGLQGINVRIVSLDKAIAQPYNDFLELARTGEIDGAHSGFPCGSFNRALQFTADLLQSQRLRKVPDCATLENPAGSEDQREGPAWCLPEVDKFMGDFDCESVGSKQKKRTRWWKPGKIGGKLPGMKALGRKCNCPKHFKHESLIGKEKTSKAAQYPTELCMEHAKLLIRKFRTVFELEWWRHQHKKKQTSFNSVQEKWAASRERLAIGKPLWTTRL